MDPKKVYCALYKEFGPQGWWPINGRYFPSLRAQRSNPGRFEIMVGAILTQGTAWGNVEKALANLRAPGALRPEAIVRMSTQRLERLIQPAGYFRQKAKKLKIFSRWMGRKGGGGWSTERLRRELLALWGIGPETADSILLYAFNRPVFVVDAYTKRLCATHGVKFKTYDEYRHFFEKRVDPKLFNEYHALIVAWGKKHGKPARKSK